MTRFAARYDRAIEIAGTIIDQFGGTRRLSAFVGAHNFAALASGVQFKFKARSLNKSNTVVVKLDASDTYTVEFWSIRGMKSRKVSEHVGIYNDQLIRLFETETKLALRF